MKQIIQDLKNGQTLLEEIPAPLVKPGHLLIRTKRTLVSLGTERMLVEFGKASLIEKARQQPDRVKQVLDKIKTDGLFPTLETVFNKLNQPLPLGYCNVGEVIEIGKGVSGFSVGDRVASNGQHAEFVCIPENLAAVVPENVSDEEAAFTVIGAIGLQGIRLLNPTFGETVVVFGLGLIGLMTAELLKADGCKVIGIDVDDQKNQLARSKGIIALNPTRGDNIVQAVLLETGGIGADGVIITASAKSDALIHEAALMSRQRGRIILVGVIGLNLQRADFYQKELTFQVSCSYGPGRYDEQYELRGQDYPIGFVRWTEKRNFEAILSAIASGAIDVKSLITEKIPLDQYMQIYGDMRKEGSIASLLVFPEQSTPVHTVSLTENQFEHGTGEFGIIGAGNFASSTIIPALKKAKASIKIIASAKGLTAKILAKKADAGMATSDYHEILKDPSISTVIITTRHDLHARLVMEGLKAGKNVFVEKPLCIREEDIQQILDVYAEARKMKPVTLTVGYNRRFAPLAVKLKELAGQGPKNIIATMNAGFIPPTVWVHDPETGGGRIIGEACHFIDLCIFLAGSSVQAVCMSALGEHPSETTDNASILLKFKNGSNAVINYFSNGSKSYSKERVEVYSQERTFVLDNWRKLHGFGTQGFSSMKTTQDKGHREQFRLLAARSVTGGDSLIPIEEIINSAKATFAALESLRKGCWIEL